MILKAIIYILILAKSKTPLKLHVDFQIPEGLGAGWKITSGSLGLEHNH